MSVTVIAALAYAVATVVTVAFQIALALGAPLGEYAMGGRFPGRFPPAMRVGEVVQALLLGFLAAVVVSSAGLALPRLSESVPWLIWLAVAVAALSTVLNAITRSRRERAVWLPVALLQLASSLIVAIGA